MYSKDECCAKAIAPMTPIEPLNAIAEDVIQMLRAVRNQTESIAVGLFSPNSLDNAKCPEPCSLEQRLQYIRAIAQEINNGLEKIACRV